MIAPRTQAELLRAQATDALRRGEAARAGNDPDAARAWLARARRIVPDDPAVAFALASAMLRLGDPQAASLFTAAANATHTREAWLGVSAASRQAGDHATAAASLHRVLSGYVLPNPVSQITGLADAVAAASGEAGWCGVVADGAERALRIVTSPGLKPRVVIDGKALRGTALPRGRSARVLCDGRELLGSPIDLAGMRAAEGFVGAGTEGGLAGWIWLPADPDADPRLTVTAGGRTVMVLDASDTDMPAPRPLARPRRFVVTAAELAGLPGKLRVIGPDGVELAGSPVDPMAESRAALWIARRAAEAAPARLPRHGGKVLTGPDDLAAAARLRGPAAVASAAPDRPVAVVVPVFRGLELTLNGLHSVLATTPPGTRLIVVDDATPEPDLAGALDELAASGRITLLRHARNLGFPASANAGLRAAFALRPRHDALLLNSDTLVPGSGARAGWLERLRACVHASPDIGTATPLSNDATILTYPDRERPGPVPDAASLARLDALAARANGAEIVEIPTAVGFCMYLRHECLGESGVFREALFAQGYGEENDFCIRARHLGWRHVAVPGVVVGHVGGVSFGAARAALIARNLAVLERLHPGYAALIADYEGIVPAADPLAPARRRIDALRWAEARARPSGRRAVILVTHENGGGVERVVRRRVAELAAQGTRAILLRPVPDPTSEGGCMPGLCRVDDGGGAYPNLVYRLPDEQAALARLLRADRPDAFEVHHRLGHHPSVIDLAAALDLPVDLMLHDYACFCPRVSLLGPEQRYCGEPDAVATCEACVADAGSRLGEAIGVAELRTRSAREFAAARSVRVPSADMANRLRRHFPRIGPTVVPLEDDAALPPPAQPPPGPRRRICVIGAIGIEKGFDVLLACARDAAARDLQLEFVLVGRSTDDDRLIDTGRVFVTGHYQEADALALIQAQAAHLAFLPSIWPETWGFTLGLAWQAGLQAAVFDIGAMAARVRSTGRGLVLPLGLSAASINNTLISPGPFAGSPSLAQRR